MGPVFRTGPNVGCPKMQKYKLDFASIRLLARDPAKNERKTLQTYQAKRWENVMEKGLHIWAKSGKYRVCTIATRLRDHPLCDVGHRQFVDAL